jgi:hypothetical protein
MAFGLRLSDQDYREFGGAVAMAPLTDLLDLKLNRFVPRVENGQLAEGAVLVADAFLTSGGKYRDFLHGAALASAGFLARDVSTRYLNPVVAPAVQVTAAPPAGGAAAPAAAVGAVQPGTQAMSAASAFEHAQAAF